MHVPYKVALPLNHLIEALLFGFCTSGNAAWELRASKGIGTTKRGLSSLFAVL